MRKVNPIGKGSFARKVFRALGMNGDFESPLVTEKKKPSCASTYHAYCSHREFANAMLEAEISKAEGIMEYQRRNLPH